MRPSSPLSRVDSWPAWTKPPLLGAAALFIIVAVRMVFALPVMLGNADARRGALVALLAATGAGALGGLAYSFIGRPLLGVPVIGRYLTGIVCIAAYLTPLLYWSGRIFGGAAALDFHKTSDVVIWLFCVLLFGIVVGQSWFDPPSRAGKPREPAT